MPRYRQVWNEETRTSSFVEIGVSSHSQKSASVHGDITAFVSPVDGSVISDRKQLRDHNKRNNVVNASEFETEYYQKKREQKDAAARGELTPKQRIERGEEISRIWDHHQNKMR